jgi:DNA-binding SARP family transcriptional activator
VFHPLLATGQDWHHETVVGHGLSRDELAAELWLDEPPPSWERSLSVLISKIRATPGRADLADALMSAFGCYQLRLPAETWIDIEAAVAALEKAEVALRAGSMLDVVSQVE